MVVMRGTCSSKKKDEHSAYIRKVWPKDSLHGMIITTRELSKDVIHINHDPPR